MFRWRRGGKDDYLANAGSVELIEDKPNSPLTMGSSLDIDFRQPVFVVESDGDVAINFDGGQSKSVRVCLGMSKAVFARFVDQKPVRVQIKASAPPGKRDNRLYIVGNMRTGSLVLGNGSNHRMVRSP